MQQEFPEFAKERSLMYQIQMKFRLKYRKFGVTKSVTELIPVTTNKQSFGLSKLLGQILEKKIQGKSAFPQRTQKKNY